jgi:tetratricopeptide (TPR) repeat protein
LRRTLLALCLIPIAISSSYAVSAPVNCTELLGWLAGGASNHALVTAVGERGAALHWTPALKNELRAAGASEQLLEVLGRKQAASGPVSGCPAHLSQAAADAHEKNFDEAAQIVSGMLEADPNSGPLHFAMGYFDQQRGDWDNAFDEYTASKEAEPGFEQVHDRLALVFYDGEDGDNVIAEARTALSMDFDDPEAYRMLALGHYANEQYAAAMNAFQEALARDPRWGWWTGTRTRPRRQFSISGSHCS